MPRRSLSEAVGKQRKRLAPEGPSESTCLRLPPTLRSFSSIETLGSMPARHFNLEAIIRPNILALQPYRCARDDYQSGVLMDANENAYGHSIASTTVEESSTASQKEEAAFLAEHIAAPLHRYPDPSHPLVKSAYASLRGISGPERVFLGVGSDEVIDLLFRVTCVPGKDKILACPPTYGMYSVCAQVNDVAVVNVPQDTTGGRFSIQVDEVSYCVYLKRNPLLTFFRS
jgi:histidinol-phosphate aminotransferase